MPVRQPLEPSTSNTITPVGPARPIAPPISGGNLGGMRSPRPIGTPGMGGPRQMPVFHKGTDNVSSTGPALLEKGEAVLNKHDAAQMRKGKGMEKNKSMESATHALSGGKKEEKPKKEVSEMHIKRAANGGHIIKHKHSAPEHHPDEEHTTKGDDELAQHVMQHMGDQNPGEADADAGNSGIPPQAGASAAPPAAAPAAAPMAGAPAGM